MPNINVLNQNGEVVSELKLNEAVWGIEPNKQAIFDAVLVYNANSRQGTSKVKTRAEVRGGGKKPWRQKGTGRARQGSNRSPQWVGGGVAWGPTGNKNYKLKLNKKVRMLALKSALSAKLADDEVKVINGLKFDNHKTKSMVQCLEKLNLEGKTVVVFGDDIDDNAMIAGYNIPSLYLVWVGYLNVYTIMDCKNIVFTVGAVEEIEGVLLNGSSEEE